MISALAFFGVGITLYAHRAELGDVPVVALIGPVLVIPLLVGIMVGAIAFGRRLGRDEEGYLVDWLRRTLAAR